jgi:egghead protein (zeste-white 4 protein)
MSTDHLGDQAQARLKQLRSQRQIQKNTTQGDLPHPEIFQTQPLSTALAAQGFSLTGHEDIWQRTTLPVKIAETPASALAMPGFSLADNEDIWQRTTLPVKIVETPVPTELSPIERVPVTPEQMLITMPPAQAMPVTPQMQRDGVSAILITWFYRIWLICTTLLLMFLLFWLQAQLDRVHVHPSIWRTVVQWAELTWLTPIPLAFVLWIGWFFFAEAARPDPLHVSAPVIVPQKQGIFAFAPPKPARLVFRFVTRGDNVDILRDSVIAVHQAFARYQQFCGPYAIEIISERPISLNLGSDSRVRIYVVPPTYVTPHLSRFKARALTYLQEQVHPRYEDWYIYLDEESLVNEHMLAGVYRFIWRSIEAEQRAQKEGKQPLPTRLIGQGAILYQGGNWFFRGADALRTADDLGRFRLQYALGVPMFGVHGSYIVVRGIHDRQLSFDVGKANSITEDAAWALRAWSQGFRFAWVHGYLHEQPPQKARDFVRQRSRWLSGIRAVLRDRQTPFPYRLCLGMFTTLWQFAFLPFLVAVVALIIHASPFYWIRLPADFAWATFTLAYLQGIDIQSRYPHPFLKKGVFELQWKRAVSWLLILCSIWYALLEAVGVLYSFKPGQGFFVIHKPSLAAENKKVKRPRPQ